MTQNTLQHCHLLNREMLQNPEVQRNRILGLSNSRLDRLHPKFLSSSSQNVAFEAVKLVGHEHSILISADIFLLVHAFLPEVHEI